MRTEGGSPTPLREGRFRRARFIRGLAFALTAVSLALPQDSPPPPRSGGESFPEVRLRNRRFVPAPGEDPTLAKPLDDGVVGRVHALAHFKRPPSPALRRALAARGVRILERVVGTSYVVSLARGFSFPDAPGAESPAFAVTPIEPDDRLGLKKRRFDEILAAQPDPDGRVRCLVSFHRDVTPREASAVLARHSTSFEVHRPPRVWRARLAWPAVRAVSREDDVRWVNELPTRFPELVDSARSAIDADAVQKAVVGGSPIRYDGLDGHGVRLAFVNDGFDVNHDDFWDHDDAGLRTASRAELTQPADEHGTWVASLAAGSGFQSDKTSVTGAPNLGEPYQWRGVAPASSIAAVALGLSGDPLGLRAAGSWGADVTNHSYALNINGTYDLNEEEVDDVIAGRAVGVGGVPERRLVGVWGAGNNGVSARSGYGSLRGYFSIFCSAKNAIVAAASDSLVAPPLGVWLKSGRGPTFDGRLKPDVVAPGCRGGSNAFRAALVNTNGYEQSTDCATSWATAIVSGSAALLFEQWRSTFATAPVLPSTIKAVLIQGARDLAETQAYASGTTDPDTLQSSVTLPSGPDWVGGYGVIDVAASQAVIADGRVEQGSLDADGETATFQIAVPEGSSSLRVTLAWDDAPASPLADLESAKLQNDLDLVVVGPEGENAQTYLPWVLMPLPASSPAGDPAFIEAAAAPASRGVDRLNNVEQVEVAAPAAGLWSITVTAYRLGSLDTQDFSLAVSHPFADPLQPPGSVTGLRRTDPL